jgi:hypothetical protein
MLHSETFIEISKALGLVQAKLKHAKKTTTNPDYNKSYATLADVWDTIRASLSANGLAVWQSPETMCYPDRAPLVTMSTMIIHTPSGEWVENVLSASPKDDGPQAVGSTITYLRRYALSSMLGVSPADDDGNAGNGKPTPEATGQTQETPPPKPVSKTGKATQDVVVDGVVVWSKSNDIRGEFNDLRQKETGCIDTSQWRDIETQIKNVLGGSKLAFAAWLKSVYGVEWYNIKLEMYDGIYATITKSPLEVMKFKPKAK